MGFFGKRTSSSLFGIEATNVDELMLKLFSCSPRYFREPRNDMRLELGDEVNADAWEVLGNGSLVYVSMGSNPNWCQPSSSAYLSESGIKTSNVIPTQPIAESI
jgi:hypothetical protein